MADQPIEFYFDFSSPYGYLAATQIDGLAARYEREVTWRPFLLGAAFKETGQRPLTEQTLRGPYHRHDFARSARLVGVPFQLPDPFPFASVAACRAYYWLEAADAAAARRLADALYRAAFAETRRITAADEVAAVAADSGIDAAALRAGIEEPAVKARLRQETDGALARGVFGSPFIIVDGEPFWGHDRLPQVERWLATGGW
jgi:2-hydroxychromene-2-carboxylate isomerase